MSSRVMKAAACGGDQRGLDGELEEKLLLHDAGLARCSAAGAAAAGLGGADDAGDYRERFVRAYDRLRDELLADDSCDLTDEAKRWVAKVRGCRQVVVRIRMPYACRHDHDASRFSNGIHNTRDRETEAPFGSSSTPNDTREFYMHKVVNKVYL